MLHARSQRRSLRHCTCADTAAHQPESRSSPNDDQYAESGHAMTASASYAAIAAACSVAVSTSGSSLSAPSAIGFALPGHLCKLVERGSTGSPTACASLTNE